MTDFTLTQEQLDRLVFEVAKALDLPGVELGADFASTSPELIEAWRQDIVGRDAMNVPEPKGTFVKVYQLVSDFVTDRNSSDLQPLPGVDKSGWVFLRAGANVNAGQTLEAFMTRE